MLTPYSACAWVKPSYTSWSIRPLREKDDVVQILRGLLRSLLIPIHVQGIYAVGGVRLREALDTQVAQSGHCVRRT